MQAGRTAKLARPVLRSSQIFLIAMLALLGTATAAAQSQVSAYSRGGYGLLNDYASGAQRAMGGVGYAMNNGRQINVMNPASYAMCDSLTFLWDIGLDMTNLWQEEDGTHGYTFGGGLDYITMQFPISKKMGASIGLVPFSTVGYGYTADLDDDGASEAREGVGGINQLYAGVAYRFFDLISIGVNFSYNFGSVSNQTYVYTSESSTSIFDHVVKVQDWGVNFGLQISKVFKRKHRLTLGAAYTPAKDLHGKTWGTYYNYTSDSSVDTVGYQKMGGDFSTPHMIGGGINYTYDDRITLEADFSYQSWGSAKFKDIELFSETEFNDRYRGAFGVQIIPKHRGNFVQRTNYRFGAYYTRDYITVRGNEVREYGITMGFGMPSMFTKTMINLSLEYKHRYSSPTNYITEDYFFITLGINFNEMWFWKNKLR